MAGDKSKRIDVILREVARWDSGDVADLADALDGLLRGRREAAQALAERQARGDEARPSGHVEIKTIHGHQYRYLRYWEGGRLRSLYLGKVEKYE